MKFLSLILSVLINVAPVSSGLPYWHDLPAADKMVMGELKLERGLDGKWRVK